MEIDNVPLDDKAKRMRDLLSSFYAPDPSATPSPTSQASLDAINTASFDPDQYMNLLVRYPHFRLQFAKSDTIGCICFQFVEFDQFLARFRAEFYVKIV